MAAVVGLTPAQLHEITGSRPQASSMSCIGIGWQYAMRYQAQPILDFLFLGPSSIARDRQFLEQAGITMLLAVRDTRMVMAQLLSMDKAARDAGLTLHSIDVSSPAELIQALPGAVKIINGHMLDAPRDENGASKGRVLVLCETGNGRSASLVVAYVMAMYGLQLRQALAFVQERRFSMGLDEDTKHMLMSYGEILLAQGDVAMHADNAADFASIPNTESTNVAIFSQPKTGESSATSEAPTRAPLASGTLPSEAGGGSRPCKRRIEDTLEIADDCLGAVSTIDRTLDKERFANRSAFKPFRDKHVN